tara:strand:+ start:2614 stop:2865 length:252 start_codon:yes stop_codon:yes gene_type:complete
MNLTTIVCVVLSHSSETGRRKAMGSDGNTVEIPQEKLQAALASMRKEEETKLAEVHEVLQEAAWRLGEVMEIIKPKEFGDNNG